MRVIKGALKGIKKILELGEDDKEAASSEVNEFARLVEEAEGKDRLEALSSHSNDEVCQRAVQILEADFGEEEAADAPSRIPEPATRMAVD